MPLHLEMKEVTNKSILLVYAVNIKFITQRLPKPVHPIVGTEQAAVLAHGRDEEHVITVVAITNLLRLERVHRLQTPAIAPAP